MTERIADYAAAGGNTTLACDALGVRRSTHYDRVRPKKLVPSPRRRSTRALSAEEREQVAAVLHDERFCDKAPAAVYAQLLDEEIYLCSISTMYRVLRERNEVRERRNQARRRDYSKPELLATAPKQVWSWDITKLKGAQKGELFSLYVIIDIFSRYVVGWMLAAGESALLAERLIAEACHRQEIRRDKLVIHSDRGAPMTAQRVCDLLNALGVSKSLGRPQVCNDNAFSESQFKTMKYRPEFPLRFGSFQDAEAFCDGFFDWYNNEHFHSSLALMTPRVVHYGLAQQVSEQRQAVLNEAFARHPQRFVNGAPQTLQLPEAAWINPPKPAKSPVLVLPDQARRGVARGGTRVGATV